MKNILSLFVCRAGLMIVKVRQFCSVQVAEDRKIPRFADIAISTEDICDFIQDFAVVSTTK